jgi:predicted DNA-binding antitoxin AbrB/MazE fold protein
MTQICEAVYENGIFRPVAPVAPNLTEGQHVRLVVETDTPEEILRLAAQVYDGISEQEVNEIEQIAFDRSTFFIKPAP